MDKVRVGIIGTGSMAKKYYEAYSRNPFFEITAICGQNAGKTESRAKEFNINEFYTDYKEMLNSDSIDAVTVTTWNNTHEPITIAALDAGKHVLCEKPPALNAAQAEMMEDAAKRSGKLLMYGFIMRFAQSTKVLKDFIDRGEIGEIYYAKTGYLRRYGSPGGWYANKELSGGGPLIDLGVHIIDRSLYIMGKPRPISVFGNTYNKLGNRSNILGKTSYKAADSQECSNVEDLASAIIKFENGASLFFEASWSANIKSGIRYLELFGDKGGASLEPELEIFGEKNDYMMDFKPVIDNSSFNFQQAISEQISHFADCILNNNPCISPAEDGVTIMKIIDAIYESARTGDIVKL